MVIDTRGLSESDRCQKISHYQTTEVFKEIDQFMINYSRVMTEPPHREQVRRCTFGQSLKLNDLEQVVLNTLLLYYNLYHHYYISF